MAATVISDIIVPSVFAQYVQLLTSQRSAFVRSGVMVMDPRVDGLLAGGGRTFDMPFFNDLADTESNVSADSGTATALNITTGREVAMRQSRNQVWGSFDLAGALAGADPLEAIASRVADYWVRQQQQIVIRSIRGLIADNIANDSSDMVNSISAGSGTVTDANRFSAEAFLDTVQTMGDRGEELVAVAVHSTIYRRMQKLDLIDFIKDSADRSIPTYQGRQVIVDDGMPRVANGSNFDFSTYLFSRGALIAGVGTPKVPVEVERQPLAGTGGGSENLHSRVEWIIHPVGFAVLTAGVAGQGGPTFAELILAAAWDRRVERKLVGIAELRTSG